MKSQPFKIGQIYRSDGKPVTLPSVLADRQTMKVSTMMRDSETNGVCDTCNGTGRWTDARLRCPDCGGTGGSVREALNSMTTQTESSRGGAFGTDHATTLSDADRRVHDYMLDHAKYGSHRPGFRIDSSPEGRAARQKTFDAITEMEAERARAWKNVSTFEANTATLSVMPSQEEMERIKRNAPPREDNRTVSQVAADHAQNMENVYQEHATYLQNAWRNLR
jgi:hypothetical protein